MERTAAGRQFLSWSLLFFAGKSQHPGLHGLGAYWNRFVASGIIQAIGEGGLGPSDAARVVCKLIDRLIDAYFFGFTDRTCEISLRPRRRRKRLSCLARNRDP